MARGFTVDLSEQTASAWQDVVRRNGGYGHNMGVYVVGREGDEMPVLFHDSRYPLAGDRRYRELAQLAGDAGEALGYDFGASAGEEVGTAEPVVIAAGRVACYFLYDPHTVRLSRVHKQVKQQLAEMVMRAGVRQEADPAVVAVEA